MAEQSAAVTAAIEGELLLLDPEVRRDPERVGALLHEEFTEFGASGAFWDRTSMLEAIATSDFDGGTQFVASRMRGVQLADDLVQLTFDTENGGRHAHRSSLWRLTPEGWRLWFHQATLFTPQS
ncbi:DUF4440 domain-containing protein [Streptomyces indicus]|uniref:DUF4440 domain-containing protein n=1 Tax=Streptomyces indicus TaxID=417292 RepID=A0A1G8V7L5_9ACTN|nr:DUF4440 domain-containing protein [Streptomyces indicus]SDJ61874.1 hypothetical protein SAMN05421806_1011295 [Streptomyces indicus]